MFFSSSHSACFRQIELAVPVPAEHSIRWRDWNSAHVWFQMVKVDEMSRKNPPYTLYTRDIVMTNEDDFIGQRSVCVTLFLRSMISVTFLDKARILSHRFAESILDK